MISGASVGVITVLEAKEGKTMLSFHAHREGVLSLAFHPNGRYFATTGRDHMLKIWSVHDGNLVYVVGFAQSLALENTAKPELAYFLFRVFAVSFSPDGKYMATSARVVRPENECMCSGVVHIWNVEDLREEPRH